MANAIDRGNNILWIKNRLAQQMWQHVIPHPANGGLWNGEAADFSRTKAIHHKLLADGKIEEANALRAVVTHNVWYAQRATKDHEDWSCPRCGDGDETLLHRLWTCKDIANCDHPDVIGTKDLINETIRGCPDEGPSQSAFWLGAYSLRTCYLQNHRPYKGLNAMRL